MGDVHMPGIYHHAPHGHHTHDSKWTAISPPQDHHHHHLWLQPSTSGSKWSDTSP